MRTGGVYLSPVGGHWRDLLHWRERVPELRLHDRHLARRALPLFAAAYPTLFGLASDDELELERYVEELGPAGRGRPRLRRPRPARRGPALRARRARPRPGRPPARRAGAVHRRRDQRARPAGSADMKAGYRAIERALRTGRAARREPLPRAGGACRPTTSTGRRCSAAATRCPSVLELQERFGGRRVLITGGGGSIGRALATLPARLPARARDAARRPRGLADRRPPRPSGGRARRHLLARALRHPRRRAGSTASWQRRGPTSSSTSPPTSTSTGPRSTPRSSSTRTCTGAGTCCAPPKLPASRPWSSPRPTRRRWPRASTGGRSASWSSSRRTRRARRRRADRGAVRQRARLAPAARPSSSCARRAPACR